MQLNKELDLSFAPQDGSRELGWERYRCQQGWGQGDTQNRTELRGKSLVAGLCCAPGVGEGAASTFLQEPGANATETGTAQLQLH